MLGCYICLFTNLQSKRRLVQWSVW